MNFNTLSRFQSERKPFNFLSTESDRQSAKDFQNSRHTTYEQKGPESLRPSSSNHFSRHLSPPAFLEQKTRASRNINDSATDNSGFLSPSSNFYCGRPHFASVQFPECDAFSETAQEVVQSPKPRLSGYFRPGLKSSLGYKQSSKVISRRKLTSGCKIFTSPLANQKRMQTTPRQFKVESAEHRTDISGTSPNSARSYYERPLPQTHIPPNSSHKKNLSEKSSLSNALTYFTTTSLVSAKKSALGLLRAIKNSSSSFSRTAEDKEEMYNFVTPSNSMKNIDSLSSRKQETGQQMLMGSHSLSSSPRFNYPQLSGGYSTMKPGSTVNKQVSEKITVTPFRSKQASKGAKPPLFSSKSAAEIKQTFQSTKQKQMTAEEKENLQKTDVKEETKPQSPHISKKELANLLIEIKEVQDTGYTQTSLEESSPLHQIVQSIAAETCSLGEESVIKEIPITIANKIPQSKIGTTPQADCKFRSHTEENLASYYDQPLPHTETQPKDTGEIEKKFNFHEQKVISPRSLGNLAFSNCQLIKPHRSTKPSFNQICSLIRQNCVQKLRTLFETDPKYFRKMLAQKEEKSGFKLLHIATIDSTFDMCDLLLSVGAQIKDKVEAFPNKSALHLAAEQGEIPLFSLYLTKDPDAINLQDEEGNTPLHAAAEAKNIHILDFVLTQCQSFDQNRIILKANKNGMHPQDIVRKCGNSVQIHSVAQNLEKLRKFVKNPKMKEVEIQQTTATSIDRVLGHLLKRKKSPQIPMVQRHEGDQDLVSPLDVDSSKLATSQSHSNFPKPLSGKLRPKLYQEPEKRPTRKFHQKMRSEGEQFSYSTNYLSSSLSDRIGRVINDPSHFMFSKGTPTSQKKFLDCNLSNSRSKGKDANSRNLDSLTSYTPNVHYSYNLQEKIKQKFLKSKFSKELERKQSDPHLRTNHTLDQNFIRKLKQLQRAQNTSAKNQSLYYRAINSDRSAKSRNNKITAQSKQTGSSSNSSYGKASLREESKLLRDKRKIKPTQKGFLSASLDDRSLLTKEETRKIGAEDFVAHALLGSGAFGQVYLVEKLDTGQPFAMKVLKKKSLSNFLVKYAVTERNVLSSAHHPFIVQLHCAFQTNDKLFLILTFCAGGDLCDYLSKNGPLSEAQARIFLSELTLAIEYLHSLDIIYRDLKPENVVLDGEGHVLLTDFGLSKEGVNDESLTKTFCGSPAYLAPEMIIQKGHGKAVDWYNLGAFLYEMVCGMPPFYADTRQQIQNMILHKEVEFPKNPHISSACRDLIKNVKEAIIPSYLKRIQRSGQAVGRKEVKQSKDILGFVKLTGKMKLKPPTPYIKKYQKLSRATNQNVACQANSGTAELDDRFGGWSFVRSPDY